MKRRGFNPTSLAAATRDRTKQPQIHRFLTGESKEPRRSTLAPVAEVLQIPVAALLDRSAARAEWAKLTATDQASSLDGIHRLDTGDASPLLAQDLIQPLDTMEPITLEWESLVSAVPDRFALVIRDEAIANMAPGHKAIFSASRIPRAGEVVLLMDRDDVPYIRRYQVRRPGHWLAVADGAGFAPLDSQTDGLRLLAVLVGHTWA